MPPRTPEVMRPTVASALVTPGGSLTTSLIVLGFAAFQFTLDTEGSVMNCDHVQYSRAPNVVEIGRYCVR
jgi:hypothetical protein